MKIGPYDVLGELGRGGMGVVFRVRSPDGREAALKVLVKTDRATLARFEREKRLLASLGEEQGFVGLLDSGSSSGAAWLVMPLVPGGTLRQRLEEGPLGVDETVALGAQLATALGAAHERGIVHRDVKPENVLFTRDGRPLLADLGLAKHFERGALGASQSVSLSAHGAFRGTVGYMAPEQVEDAKSVGPPADVFALGAVLYECLTGRAAHSGDSAIEVLEKVRSADVAAIGRAGVPPWLEGVVRRALARDPLERFRDGATLAWALRRDPGAADSKRSRRSRLLTILVGAGLGAIGLTGLVAFLHEAPLVPSPSKDDKRRPGPPAQSPSARELLERAMEKGRASDWAGEIADTTKAIELDPGLALAWACRGDARGMTGDLDGVISDTTKAIELDPTIANAWGNRANVRGMRGDWDGEIADDTKAIELDPNLIPAWTSRSWARGHKGDIDGALADSAKAIELDPGLARAWYNHGWARTRTGDVDGAIADTTKAIELDPKLAEAFISRGWARGQKNDLKGAVADLTKAIELDPRLADAWRNRGVARSALGELDGAILDVERFLELAPDDADAPRVRAWLAEQKAKRGR